MTEKPAEKHDYIYANNKLWCEIATKGSTKKTYYHHTDHLGTTVCITDSTGKVVCECTESAFGDIIKNTNNNFTPNFTGKFLDEGTGLYYFNARWYDSEIGRFVTEDPARDGVNWYAYCSNNPLVFLDPDGRVVDTIWDIGFTLYDIGSAIYKSSKGDNSGWIDVGLDAAAILVPGIPAGLSKIDDAVKLARKADKIGDTVRIADKVGDVAKTEKKVSESARAIKNARQSAVRKAWKQEKQMVLEKGYGTRNWTKGELKELKETGKVKGYQGHHINNVKDHPSMAGDPNNIEFLNKSELLKAHDGNYRNKTEGALLNRSIE